MILSASFSLCEYKHSTANDVLNSTEHRRPRDGLSSAPVGIWVSRVFVFLFCKGFGFLRSRIKEAALAITNKAFIIYLFSVQIIVVGKPFTERASSNPSEE